MFVCVCVGMSLLLSRATSDSESQSRKHVREYTHHLSVIFAVCDRVEDHPLAWVCRALFFEDGESCLALLTEFAKTLQTLRTVSSNLRDTTSIILEPSASDFEPAAQFLARLPVGEAGLIEPLLQSCPNPSSEPRDVPISGWAY